MTRAVPITEATSDSSRSLAVEVQRQQSARLQPAIEWGAGPQATPVIGGAT